MTSGSETNSQLAPFGEVGKSLDLELYVALRG